MAREAALRVAGWAALAFLSGGGAATAASTCVANASNIIFGSLGVGSLAGAKSAGSIYEGCAGGRPTGGNLAICNAIGAGANSASQTSRTMKNGRFAIAYDLYADAALTRPYAYPGSDVFHIPYSAVSGGFFTTTTYAKILSAAAGVAPGVYTDSYATPAQSWISFNSENMPLPTVGCGPNPAYSGLPLSFTISVTVLASCSVVAGNLNFGTVGALVANLDAKADLSVTCTNTTPYVVSLGPGAGAGATTTRRLMSGAGGTVAYGLYRDVARTLSWGQTPPPAANADTFSGVGTGAAQRLTVYGRVPPQATPRQGGYSDTVVVTLTY